MEKVIEKNLEQIKERLLNIVVEVIKVEEGCANISYEKEIREFADYTSLEAVEIIAYIEDEFNIEIEDELLGMEFITSIDSMAQIILERID